MLLLETKYGYLWRSIQSFARASRIGGISGYRDTMFSAKTHLFTAEMSKIQLTFSNNTCASTLQFRGKRRWAVPRYYPSPRMHLNYLHLSTTSLDTQQLTSCATKDVADLANSIPILFVSLVSKVARLQAVYFTN